MRRQRHRDAADPEAGQRGRRIAAEILDRHCHCGGDDEKQGAQTATAVSSPKAGGTFRGPLVGLSTGNPPSLDPERQLSFLAQIPAAFHYSRLLKFAPGKFEDVEGVTSVQIDFSNVEGDACAGVPEAPDGTLVIGSTSLACRRRWRSA